MYEKHISICVFRFLIITKATYVSGLSCKFYVDFFCLKNPNITVYCCKSTIDDSMRVQIMCFWGYLVVISAKSRT